MLFLLLNKKCFEHIVCKKERFQVPLRQNNYPSLFKFGNFTIRFIISVSE